MSAGTADQLANLRRSILWKLAVTARQSRRHFDQAVSQLGVTRSQWTVIVVVNRQPGATQRTIAHALDMSEASAGRLIDRLCGDGLLERRPKDDDRRAHCVFLTPAGEAVTSRLAEIARQNEAAALNDLAQEELERLDALLDRITQNLQAGQGGRS